MKQDCKKCTMLDPCDGIPRFDPCPMYKEVSIGKEVPAIGEELAEFWEDILENGTEGYLPLVCDE